MFIKKALMVGALLVAGTLGSFAIPDTAEARPRGYYRGGYGAYYGGYNYRRPNYGYRNYYRGYRPYYNYGYRPYYNYGYRPYYGGGVYVGRGGVSIGF